eukprot:3600487-Lingulodinium_polyedra.AAC.1
MYAYTYIEPPFREPRNYGTRPYEAEVAAVMARLLAAWNLVTAGCDLPTHRDRHGECNLDFLAVP